MIDPKSPLTYEINKTGYILTWIFCRVRTADAPDQSRWASAAVRVRRARVDVDARRLHDLLAGPARHALVEAGHVSAGHAQVALERFRVQVHLVDVADVRHVHAHASVAPFFCVIEFVVN